MGRAREEAWVQTEKEDDEEMQAPEEEANDASGRGGAARGHRTGGGSREP